MVGIEQNATEQFAKMQFGSALAGFTACSSKLDSLRPQNGTSFSEALACINKYKTLLK